MEMHELVKSLEALNQKLVEIKSMLRLEEKKKEIAELEAEVNTPGFWSDQKKAVEKSQKLGWLKEEKENWGKLSKEIKDLLEMAELDEAPARHASQPRLLTPERSDDGQVAGVAGRDKEVNPVREHDSLTIKDDMLPIGSDLYHQRESTTFSNGVNLREEIEKQYQLLNKQVGELEFGTLMSEKYDSQNAIIAIHSGSGGTEAQDWAEMLLRMYLKYCEKKKWKTEILDESKGQEAGIKSAVFRVGGVPAAGAQGRFAYGHLKSEHGTHRLVRVSPFDAEKMRHTSFALVEVIPELEETPDINIDAKDLRIDTFMSGGKGGQSVNTTYSAVRIVHIPTGITVQCQNERSQLQNKETAMKVLKSKLQKLRDEKEEEDKQKLRGEYKSPEWGSQIRSYVLHPYHLVKDLRTDYETTDDKSVLEGELEGFVESYLRWKKS